MSEPCDCLKRFQYQAKAFNKKSGLIRVKCRACGKEFLSNVEKELCYDCSHSET
jgi:ribosomal protein L37E